MVAILISPDLLRMGLRFGSLIVWPGFPLQVALDFGGFANEVVNAIGNSLVVPLSRSSRVVSETKQVIGGRVESFSEASQHFSSYILNLSAF